MSDEYLKLIRQLEAELTSAKAVIEAARILLDEMEDPNNLLDPNRRRTLRQRLEAYDARGK